MNLNSEIKLLKQNLHLYNELWEDWVKTGLSSLSEIELNAIDVHKKNEFEVTKNEMPMFYNKVEFVRNINQNLKSDYIEFQDWVILRFQYEVIQLAKLSGWETFYSMPIEELPINLELKNNLLCFKFKTLEELFLVNGDKDFRAPALFNLAKAFRVIYRRINIVDLEEELEIK